MPGGLRLRSRKRAAQALFESEAEESDGGEQDSSVAVADAGKASMGVDNSDGSSDGSAGDGAGDSSDDEDSICHFSENDNNDDGGWNG